MKTRLLILSLAVICLSSAPAMADIVWFDIEETQMTLSSTGHGDVVFEAPSMAVDPLVSASIQDTFGAQSDWADMDGTATNFDMDLDFVKVGTAWTATGSFWIKDTTTAVKVAADFTSSSVTLTAGKLEVTGPIDPSGANTSILVPTSDPWTFQGDALGMPAGKDGVADQITVPTDVYTYATGYAWVMHFSVPYSSLDNLFAAPTSSTPVFLHSGDIDVKVVPVPAAVVLGVLGLGAVGLGLRRFA